MELRLLPLISYLITGTYLMAWVIHRSWSLNVWLRDWRIRRKAAGRVSSLRSSSKKDDRVGIILSIGGSVLGVFVARWAGTYVYAEWLLLVLLAFVLLSEEFRPSQAEMNLLAVVVLLDRVITHADAESDLFEVLSKAVQEVPEGEVQLALREALHRRRSGFSGEECLAILRGVNSHLDEFILIMKRLNWQTTPAVTLAAGQLQQRAGRRWDYASRFMLLKEHVWPYVRVGRAAMLTAIFVLSYSGITVHFTAWPSRITVMWIGLVLIAAGLLLDFALASGWPRRVLVVSLLLVAFLPIMNTIDIQSPWWIRIHTTTHGRGNVSESMPGNGSFFFNWQAQSTSQNSPAPAHSAPINQDSTFAPIPTPSLNQTNMTTTTVSSPPEAPAKVFEEPCCYQLYQYR
jgi:hypothetical protein